MIPEAAVEAADDAFWACDDEQSKASMRAALEAAAPHMLAEAWDEGMITMHTTTGGEWPLIPEQNPYRPTP